MKKYFIIMASLIACAGCVSTPATPINRYNAMKHADVASFATKAGDWDVARREWARAVGNADLANLDTKQRAVYYYEYGRSAGVTCFYDIAETYLKKAYELDQSTGGPAYMSLVELFRLNLDQKKYREAVQYFKMALNDLEEVNDKNKAPAEFSKLLGEYATALDVIGEREEARKTRDRAAGIGKTAVASITERTPYGLFCK